VDQHNGRAGAGAFVVGHLLGGQGQHLGLHGDSLLEGRRGRGRKGRSEGHYIRFAVSGVRRDAASPPAVGASRGCDSWGKTQSPFIATATPASSYRLRPHGGRPCSPQGKHAPPSHHRRAVSQAPARPGPKKAPCGQRPCCLRQPLPAALGAPGPAWPRRHRWRVGRNGPDAPPAQGRARGHTSPWPKVCPKPTKVASVRLPSWSFERQPSASQRLGSRWLRRRPTGRRSARALASVGWA